MNELKPALLAVIGATALLARSEPGLDPGFFLHEPGTIMVDCADKARAAAPNNSRMLAEYGRIYLAAGAKDRALDAFQRAARIGRRDAATFALIAKAWLGHGAKAEAVAAASQVTELAPKNKTLLADLGVQFTDAGFAKEGAAFMERAYQLEPSDWEMAVDFGRACLRARQPEQAATWFRHALTGSNADNRIYRVVGLAYADRGARP